MWRRGLLSTMRVGSAQPGIVRLLEKGSTGMLPDQAANYGARTSLVYATSIIFAALMTPERQAKIEAVLSKRQGNITVVLENVFDPHNISAVMRSCDAVGIQEIYVLNTKIPRHKKWGDRSSSSANKWLTVHQFTDLEACYAELRRRFDRILTTHLSSDAVSLYETDLTLSTALVFGNEHAGVSEEFLALADGNIIIPQMGMIQSLNISVACAVTLYEAFRQKQGAGHYRQPGLLPDQHAALAQQWGLFEQNEAHDA